VRAQDEATLKSWQVVLGEQSSIELGGALPKVETVQAQKIAAETIQARQRGIRQRKKQRARQHEEAAKEFMCKTRAQDSVLMASGKASMEGKRWDEASAQFEQALTDAQAQQARPWKRSSGKAPTKFKYMWADAGLWGDAAKVNPLRWTMVTPEVLAEQMDAEVAKSVNRPVYVRTDDGDDDDERLFAGPAAVAGWIRTNLAREPGGEQRSGHATCKKCGVQVHRTSFISFPGWVYRESLSGCL
jgi:hypothetical protein